MRLIIFDWDDTFLPTAVLRTLSGCQRDTSLLAIQTDIYTDAFAILQYVCEQTLHCALSLGRVILVTNGSTTWIQMSCQEYLPQLWPILKPIPKYSAKDLIDDADQKHPSLWKIEAFQLILGRLLAVERELANAKYASSQGEPITIPEPDVVVSIGDSLHERDALFTYHRIEADLVIRSIKFVPLPDCNRLVLQHRALQRHLPQVLKLSSDLTRLDLRYFFQAYPTTQQNIESILAADDYDIIQRGASDQWTVGLNPVDLESSPLDQNSDLLQFDEHLIRMFSYSDKTCLMTDDDTATSRHQIGSRFVTKELGNQVLPLSSGNPFLVLINEPTN